MDQKDLYKHLEAIEHTASLLLDLYKQDLALLRKLTRDIAYLRTACKVQRERYPEPEGLDTASLADVLDERIAGWRSPAHRPTRLQTR